MDVIEIEDDNPLLSPDFSLPKNALNSPDCFQITAPNTLQSSMFSKTASYSPDCFQITALYSPECFSIIINQLLFVSQILTPFTASDDDEPSYCEVPSEYSDNEPVYDEGLLQDTEEAEGHSSPVYDQVPERDEYIDNKTMMLAKVDSQQVLRLHLWWLVILYSF